MLPRWDQDGKNLRTEIYEGNIGSIGNPNGFPYRFARGFPYGNPYGNPYGWHERQQHHPYGLPFDHSVVHMWESGASFYEMHVDLRHMHFILKGGQTVAFYINRMASLTLSWQS